MTRILEALHIGADGRQFGYPFAIFRPAPAVLDPGQAPVQRGVAAHVLPHPHPHSHIEHAQWFALAAYQAGTV